MRHDDAHVGPEASHDKWKQFSGTYAIPSGLLHFPIHNKVKGSIGLNGIMLVSEAANGSRIIGCLIEDF